MIKLHSIITRDNRNTATLARSPGDNHRSSDFRGIGRTDGPRTTRVARMAGRALLLNDRRTHPLKSCLLTDCPTIVLISHEFLESFLPLSLSSLHFLIFIDLGKDLEDDTPPITRLFLCRRKRQFSPIFAPIEFKRRGLTRFVRPRRKPRERGRVRMATSSDDARDFAGILPAEIPAFPDAEARRSFHSRFPLSARHEIGAGAVREVLIPRE